LLSAFRPDPVVMSISLSSSSVFSILDHMSVLLD
jgi:hypothetical protein